MKQDFDHWKQEQLSVQKALLVILFYFSSHTNFKFL